MPADNNSQSDKPRPSSDEGPRISYERPPISPLPNYTLSTVCPSCGHDTFRLACKVRCPRCGFMWDCSEL